MSSSLNAKLFPQGTPIKVISDGLVSRPVLLAGDHYQLASWNSIHYVTATSDTKFKLDETLGEPMEFNIEYALIHSAVQEEHIMTKRVVTKMGTKDAKKIMADLQNSKTVR